MSEKKVEVNAEILKELFKLAKIDVPSEITDENLLDMVYKLKNSGGDSEASSEESHEGFTPSSNNILVIDDIGVVTYQLKILFRNLGYNVQVAKDIFSGLNIKYFCSFKLCFCYYGFICFNRTRRLYAFK